MKTVHVVAAAIFDPEGRLVLAKRPDHVHQGGLWEFPGGKVEFDESVESALARELIEEIGITPKSYRPLIRVHHDYTDKKIILDVWCVTSYEGVPRGMENQEVLHVSLDKLSKYEFPAANVPIVKALSLPKAIAITGSFADEEDLLAKIKDVVKNPLVEAIQFRTDKLSDEAYLKCADLISSICGKANKKFFANRGFVFFEKIKADGFHLSQHEFNKVKAEAPSRADLKNVKCLGVSCHTVDELNSALEFGVDYAFLSPVYPTSTHPDASPIGWNHFLESVDQLSMPVYALGGLETRDLEKSFHYGAQGIAAISTFWPQ